MARRLATAIAVALVLVVTALPAATGCCLDKPGCAMAAMRASMPCCAESCSMSSPSSNRDNDVTLSPSPSADIAAGPAVVNAEPASPAIVAMVATATERTARDFTAPPPFLLNAQFRI